MSDLEAQVAAAVLAGPGNVVTVPAEGEFFVRNGTVMPVLESELVDYSDEDVSYTVWVKGDDDE